MEEKQITPIESLDIIRKMIANTRSNFSAEYSFYYLFWGWILLAAAILHLAFIKYNVTDYDFLPWPVLSGVGMLVTIIYSVRKRKAKKNQTFLDHFMQVFFSTGSLLYLVGIFVCIAGDISPNPLILLISGFYLIVSGRLLKFVPFNIGGIVFLIFAVVSCFVNMEAQLMLIAAAIVLGYLVPGYLLNKRQKEESYGI